MVIPLLQTDHHRFSPVLESLFDRRLNTGSGVSLGCTYPNHLGSDNGYRTKPKDSYP